MKKFLIFLLTFLLLICTMRVLNEKVWHVPHTDYTLTNFLNDIKTFEQDVLDKTFIGRLYEQLASIQLTTRPTWESGAGIFRNLLAQVRNIANFIRYGVGFLIGGITTISIDILGFFYALYKFFLAVFGVPIAKFLP